jgi:antirestriction protein
MEESMGPYYYSCPLGYLDKVPVVTNPGWRDCVRNYHAELAAKRQAKRLRGLLVLDAVDPDELKEGIEEMLSNGPADNAEEWAFHDYEGFGDYSVSEYEDIDGLAELGRCIEEHGLAFAAYAENIGQGADEAGFEDAYCGEWDSETAYAENLMDECYEVPDNLANYIDYAAFARDLFINDYYSVDGGAGVYVFHNC